jgi:DNA ligase-1
VKAFAMLYAALDDSTSLNDKTAALEAYFRAAPPADAAWALAFLGGRRPKRVVRAPDIRRWAAEVAGISEWMFEECYEAVGDLAETVALLLPPPTTSAGDASLAAWVEGRLLPLGQLEPTTQREALLAAWGELSEVERFVFNKLLTGAFRVGVSDKLVVRALGRVSGLSEDVLSHRLMGHWTPDAAFIERLLASDTSDADRSRPYPFYLAYPLEGTLDDLGARTDWQAEWKWDGIRSQLIRRETRHWLWSRGEELLNGRFPEVETAAALLPDGTVIDGELLAWKDGAPLPFLSLQRRIGRKTVGPKLLAEVPVRLVAYDLLELAGADLRALPLGERRTRLEGLVGRLPSGAAISLSPVISTPDWDALVTAQAESRSRAAEGLMLKRLASTYGVGRRKGDWWKWKVDPLSVDAVLIYAQAGHGRRAGLYTDYTFGVWDGDALVPFAKAYSGLTDEEIRKVDAFIRRNTLEKFGPVRTVKPELVFELHFEGIQRSARHKSGIAVRFPRMARWRTDKRPEDADSLETIRALIAP